MELRPWLAKTQTKKEMSRTRRSRNAAELHRSILQRVKIVVEGCSRSRLQQAAGQQEVVVRREVKAVTLVSAGSTDKFRVHTRSPKAQLTQRQAGAASFRSKHSARHLQSRPQPCGQTHA